MKSISYSLFGLDYKYYTGAEKNILINQKLLPEWETVIYYHPEMIRNEYIDKLSNMGAKMIDVSSFSFGNRHPKDYPFFWRFISFFNDGITISRDLDSRISEREVEYINRWLQSNKDYFIIRDHPWHSPVPSGLFGIIRRIPDFEDNFNNFISSSDLRWGTDQEILHEYMSKISNNDVFYCGYDKPETYIHRDNKDFFIGIQLDEYDNPTKPSGEQCLQYLNDLNL